MIEDALGMELAKAKAYLAGQGYRVTEKETRSKKGVDGNEARVIRVRKTGEDSVELCYAVFKTNVL